MLCVRKIKENLDSLVGSKVSVENDTGLVYGQLKKLKDGYFRTESISVEDGSHAAIEFSDKNVSKILNEDVNEVTIFVAAFDMEFVKFLAQLDANELLNLYLDKPEDYCEDVQCFHGIKEKSPDATNYQVFSILEKRWG